MMYAIEGQPSLNCLYKLFNNNTLMEDFKLGLLRLWPYRRKEQMQKLFLKLQLLCKFLPKPTQPLFLFNTFI
jgi:hypothetical protein